ncbi:MAG: hypothetical protein EZS28_053524, partial [Streblomastix strix]
HGRWFKLGNTDTVMRHYTTDQNNKEQEVELDQISEGLIEVFAGLNPSDSVIKDLEQILVELQSRKQMQRQNEQIMKQKENQQKPPIPLLGIRMPTQMQYDADQCMSERSLQSFDSIQMNQYQPSNFFIDSLEGKGQFTGLFYIQLSDEFQ